MGLHTKGPVLGARERRRGFSLRQQARVLVPLVFVWAVGFAALAGVALRGDVGELLLDPTYVGGAAWYAGVISQIGAVAWTVAACAAFATSWLALLASRRETSRFMWWGGVAGTTLLLDDLFGFHAIALPSTGVPKLLAQLVVVAPAMYWCLRYREEIRRTRFQVLFASIIASSCSALVDAAWSPGRFDYRVLFEDGAKFLGVLAWATYVVLTARDIATSILASAQKNLATVSSYGHDNEFRLEREQLESKQFECERQAEVVGR